MRIMLSTLFWATLMGVPAAASPATPADVAQQMDAYLTARSAMGGFSGAVLVARGDQVLFRKAYGYADVEKHVPYTPETRHEVASVSKMFTAMAALKLRDAGKLKLDDPICDYLSDCPAAWKPITVQELIHHSSGISDYEDRLGIGSPEYLALMTRPEATAELYADAKGRPLDFTPGSKFNYSNTGYLVLARVIQQAAGEPFERYVTDALLKPAGMVRSGVLGTGPRPAELAYGYNFGDVGWDKLVGGFRLDDGTLKRVPVLALTPPTGDAWLYSDVDDLYRWSRVMDGSTLVPAAEVQEVFTPALEGYGDGWFVGHDDTGPVYSHTGALPGYLTDFTKLQASGVTIIVLCNLDRARVAATIHALTAMAEGQPYDMPVRGKPVKLDGAAYARLMGDYRTADGATLSIGRDKDLLTASIPDRYQAGLVPLSATEFYFPLADGRVSFTLGKDGQAESLNLRYYGKDHPATRIATP